jgi:sulfide:quinone oxidoreductase
MDRPHLAPSHVLIAGAGLAGLEATLALRAFAGDRAQVTLLDPRRRFRLPAAATGRAVGGGTGIDLPLSEVAAIAGARLVAGRVDRIDAGRRLAVLAEGRVLPYDALIVAVGARGEPSLTGALPFGGHDDAIGVRAAIDDLEEVASRTGETLHLAVVVPDGCAWPLAAYELALMAEERLSDAAPNVRVTVVTAEETPLALLGPEAGAAVARTLGRAGIAVRAGAAARGVRGRRLELAGDGAVPADRVIALRRLHGPGLAGLPCDAHGFIRTAADGAVPGAPGVWAVGDGTTFPVKQGSLACAQADAAAAAIARGLGADVEEQPVEPVLREVAGGVDPAARWPIPKITGRFLAPLLLDWPGGRPGRPPAREPALAGA